MKVLVCSLLLLLVGGCRGLAPERGLPDESRGSPATEASGGEEPSASDDREGLLVRRTELCASVAAGTAANAAGDTAIPPFERLLLLSCDPYRHRRELAQAVASARQYPDWDREQHAFIALLESQTRALQALERRREELEQRLEQTIRGISEIEEAIDDRPVVAPLEQETNGG